jgi:flavin reductase (DIM6/NTAB) family NADH-FMN oxidoreductase RutF/DNA-binding IclR family transcriptional regulator
VTEARVAAIESARFREVLGQYPTGVVVVTATGTDGRPKGMTVGSFSSVSLDPPLVSFMPDRASNTWGRIREVGRFCINVLGAHQEPVCRVMATRHPARFDQLTWRPSRLGSPILDGIVAYIDCTVAAVHPAGDHDIVIGEVHDLEFVGTGGPLLFFQGGYGAFTPLSRASADADLLDELRRVDLVRPHMERIAGELRTECTAISLVGGELVLIAAAGRAPTADSPTRVGQRVPFAPPLGAVFAAWGDDDRLRHWISSLGRNADPDEAAACRRMVEVIQARGYALAVGHQDSASLEEASTQLSERKPRISRADFDAALERVRRSYNPPELQETGNEFRYISAPVFGKDDGVALTLTLWGPAGRCDRATVESYAQRLLKAAHAASEALATAS